MQRRTFVAAFGAVVLAGSYPAKAQRAGKVFRVGYLAIDLAGGNSRILEAFLVGLRDLGYVEGHNLAIEYRDAKGLPERFEDLAAELVALKVDVILAGGGTLGALAAKRATTTIPIVFPFVGDPVADGLVASLARPGGNITGLSVVTPDLVGKWFELLNQAVPHLGLVAYLLKPDSVPQATLERFRTGADVAAKAIGVRLRVVEASGPQDFERAFLDMAEAGANGLIVQTTAAFEAGGGLKRLTSLASAQRLPAVSSFKTFVEAGGLMSYGPHFLDLVRRSAGHVDKILRGTKPADLPVEQPTKFELAINLKTAKDFGLTLPQSLLQRADEVVE